MARPPNDRGQGRKPLPPADKLVVGSIRLSPAQWERLAKLGGATWLRAKIDKAKVGPTPDKALSLQDAP